MPRRAKRQTKKPVPQAEPDVPATVEGVAPLAVGEETSSHRPHQHVTTTTKEAAEPVDDFPFEEEEESTTKSAVPVTGDSKIASTDKKAKTTWAASAERRELASIFSPPRSDIKQSSTMREGHDQLFPSYLDAEDMAPGFMSLPVGSFAEDSPQRAESMDEDDRLGRKRSPPSHLYRYTAPPGHAFPSYRREGYHNYTFGYHPTPYSWAPGYYAEASPKRPPYELPERKPASPLQDLPHKTPEKNRPSRGDPFRSPAQRRSPHGHGSPPLAGYGSFGVDTPGGMLDAFSPMGPSFEDSFSRDTDPKISLQSELNAEPVQSSDVKRPATTTRGQSSPMDLISSFSPMGSAKGAGFSRSAPDRRSQASRPALPEEPKTVPKAASRPRSSPEPRRQLYTEQSSAARSSNAMRLQLGNHPSNQRFLEGINSKMQRAHAESRGASAASMPHPMHAGAHPGAHHYGVPYYHHAYPPPPMSSQAPPNPSPSSRHGVGHPPASIPTYHYGHQSLPLSQPSSASKHTIVARSSDSKPRSKAAPQDAGGGKENSTAVEKKRTVCNCKKSRCLKLYCECFSAERFCDGCNCTDCSNIPAFAGIRDKAIKETRAKNPQAFKPRVANAHNMGCKCKRSECLKKYCECFEARVLCSAKCKCTGCMNQAGSQKLIDKRRKMKDAVGAEFAMREAEKTWKAQMPARKPSVAPPRMSSQTQTASAPKPNPSPIAVSTASYTPHGPPPSGGHRYMPPYAGPPGPIGYSPMGVHPSYSVKTNESMLFLPPTAVPSPIKKRSGPAKGVESEPNEKAPKIPRKNLSSAVSSLLAKMPVTRKEETHPYFGSHVDKLPMVTALNIFTYLSKEDLGKASLVCKLWRDVSRREELSHLG